MLHTCLLRHHRPRVHRFRHDLRRGTRRVRGDFPTIQAAIDASSNGDIIGLSDGTFTDAGNRDVDFAGRAVTVRSQNDDPETCIIDCERNEAAMGGGMCGGKLSTLTGCSFIGNESVRGGGLARAWATILTDCEFFGNKARYGGGVYIRSSCSPTLTGCTFEGNSASHSGDAPYTLHENSPCEPEHNPACGLIGAWDVGCGVTPVE